MSQDTSAALCTQAQRDYRSLFIFQTPWRKSKQRGRGKTNDLTSGTVLCTCVLNHFSYPLQTRNNNAKTTNLRGLRASGNPDGKLLKIHISRWNLSLFTCYAEVEVWRHDRQRTHPVELNDQEKRFFLCVSKVFKNVSCQHDMLIQRLITEW